MVTTIVSDRGHRFKMCETYDTSSLCWVGYRFHLRTAGGPNSFNVSDDTELFARNGKSHKRFRTYKSYVTEILLRSTNVLFSLTSPDEVRRTFPIFIRHGDDPLATSPEWPHSHTMDVREDNVYLRFDSGLFQLVTFTITGFLQWQRHPRPMHFCIMENESSGDPFAAAILGSFGPDDPRMFAMVFHPESRDADIRMFELLEKHKNAIRNLSLQAK